MKALRALVALAAALRADVAVAQDQIAQDPIAGDPVAQDPAARRTIAAGDPITRRDLIAQYASGKPDKPYRAFKNNGGKLARGGWSSSSSKSSKSTDTPTLFPTTSPTLFPTESPTEQPTESPTWCYSSSSSWWSSSSSSSRRGLRRAAKDDGGDLDLDFGGERKLADYDRDGGKGWSAKARKHRSGADGRLGYERAGSRKLDDVDRGGKPKDYRGGWSSSSSSKSCTSTGKSTSSTSDEGRVESPAEPESSSPDDRMDFGSDPMARAGGWDHGERRHLG